MQSIALTPVQVGNVLAQVPEPARSDRRVVYADGALRVPDDIAAPFLAANPNTAPLPPPSAYSEAIQAHVDAIAASRGYGSGVLLASYVASAVPAWAAEAQAFVSWRDGVWTYSLAQLAAIQAATRPQPSVAALVAELPAIVWPS